MNRAKELKKNTLILAIGNFLPKLVSILTLPIVTAALSKEEYGKYDLVLTLVTLLLPIATLQIQSAAFRFLIENRNNKKNKQEIISSIFFCTIPAAFIVSIFFMILGKNFDIFTRFIVCLYFLADIAFITTSQVSRGLSFNKDYSISSILLATINALGIIVSLKIVNIGLLGTIISLLVANVIAVLYLITKNKLYKFVKIKYFSKKTLKEMISYSWPMIPNNLSGWVLSLSDRLIITNFINLEANAIYAVANKIPNLLSIAQNVFVMAWHENASISVKDKNVDKYYSDMYDSILKLMVGIAGLLIGFCPLIFAILIRGDYSRAYYEMPILFLAMLFNCMSSFLGGIYIAHKKTVNLGITTFIAALLNVIIDLILINKIGITAGSLSTLVSYFILYMYRVFDIKKFQQINYKIGNHFIYLINIIAMLFICYLNTKILNIVNVIYGILIFVILNKKQLDNMINSIVKKGRKYEKS